ncbi:MAG: two-component regulator propeller domain-containing protein [Vicinamibacteria bacterium]
MRPATSRRRSEPGRALAGSYGRRLGVLGLVCVALHGVATAGADTARLGLVSFVRVPMPDDTPARLCSALAQDAAGFLWLGTQDGLVRYDGYDWRVYPPDPSDARALAGAYVRVLLPTPDGRVWAGTFDGGLSVYEPETDSFRTYRRGPAGLSSDRVEGLAQDGEGRIWIATDGGLDRLDPRNGRIDRLTHDPADPRSLAADRVRALLVDREDRLWIGTRDGLQVYRDGSFERVASDPGQPGSLAGELVTKLWEDAEGRLWIGTAEHGAAVLDRERGSLRRLRPRPDDPAGLSHFWVYGIAQATADEVWIATFGGGVDVVEPKTLRVVERLRHDPALDSTLGGDRVGAILRDRAGLLWVGTWGQGLARHDPSTRAFRALRSSPRRPQGLSHPAAVRSLQARDGALWVGTNGNGVDLIDLALGRIGGHRPDPRDPGALSDGSITCLAESEDGSIWAATLNGDLHRWRPGARRFERLTPREGLAGGPIRALTFDRSGALWAGSTGGLARIDPRTHAVRVYRSQPGDATTLTSDTVESIASAPDGTLWVGTDAGLNAFDPASGRSQRIVRDPSRADSLPHDWIPDMAFVDGRLWLATQGGAAVLSSWDGRQASFDDVARRLGRPAEPVRSLIEDAEGQVWLGPRLRVDPRRWRYREFSSAEGVTLANFYFASRARTRDGALLFGSPDGLLVVRPEQIAAWGYEPSLAVTGGRAGGAALRLPLGAGSLSLPASARSIRLEFAALDLSAPARNRYRFRLEGFDPDWTETDAAHRSIAYTNLPPGSFALRVQGSNRDGVWSPREIRIPLEVPPVFAETRGFRVLVGLGLGLAGYSAYRLRVRGLRQRGLELERVVAERTRDLQAAYARIEAASLTDPLTGLHNRRFLEQAIATDLATALRRSREGSREADLVFLLLDLDEFKSVNDTYGHAAGDAVLAQLSGLLRRNVRSADHVVRWGGEEFLVVARFVERGQAEEIAEKLRAAVEAHAFALADGRIVRRTASIGFASFPFSPEQAEAVGWEQSVDVADAGLYVAKRSGRNRWIGVAAVPGEDPKGAIAAFERGAQEAVELGRVRLVASPSRGARWA